MKVGKTKSFVKYYQRLPKRIKQKVDNKLILHVVGPHDKGLKRR